MLLYCESGKQRLYRLCLFCHFLKSRFYSIIFVFLFLRVQPAVCLTWRFVITTQCTSNTLPFELCTRLRHYEWACASSYCGGQRNVILPRLRNYLGFALQELFSVHLLLHYTFPESGKLQQLRNLIDPINLNGDQLF